VKGYVHEVVIACASEVTKRGNAAVAQSLKTLGTMMPCIRSRIETGSR
jgi:hypothetical protein